MWKLIAFIVAAIICAGWLLVREIRLDRIAREDEQMWLNQTRDTDEAGKRWPSKTDI